MSRFRRQAFGARIPLGKTETALRLLYDRRQRLTGFVPIGSAEPDTPDGPIRVVRRLRGFTLDDNARERFATGLGLLDSIGYRRLQKLSRN